MIRQRDADGGRRFDDRDGDRRVVVVRPLGVRRLDPQGAEHGSASQDQPRRRWRADVLSAAVVIDLGLGRPPVR
jgi:hypothetical protein